MIDYICWIFITAAIDKAIVPEFKFPILPSIILTIVCIFEINSCFTNYCEAHQIPYTVNLFKLLRKKFENLEIEVESLTVKNEENENKS